VPRHQAQQGAPARRGDTGGERAPEQEGGGAGAEGAQEVRLQVVAGAHPARRARAAAHDRLADVLLRLPLPEVVRVLAPAAQPLACSIHHLTFNLCELTLSSKGDMSSKVVTEPPQK
jgi:hypothetical protein